MRPFPLDPESEPELQELWGEAVLGLDRGLENPEGVKWLTLRGGLMGDIEPITIPGGLSQFSRLQVLAIEHYMSVEITEVIGELPELDTLILLGNEFRTGSSTLGEHLPSASKLRALYVDCFSPLELSKDLGTCNSLRKLWIDDCECDGTEVLGELAQLEELSIDFDLADQLPKLTGLTRLRLIRSEPPPECVAELNLETLALHRLRQAALPEWVGGMESLQMHDLFQSDVSEIPDGLSGLRGLCVTGSPLADKAGELRARFPGVDIIS